MFGINPNQARGYAIAAVCVLALSFQLGTAGAGKHFTYTNPLDYPEDEYAPMMFKRLKEIGGGPRGLQNGLAGVKWGAPLASFPHMKRVEDLGGTEATQTNGLYRNGDENLVLNGVPVSPVRYWFVDEQLGSVFLGYQGRENWGKLKGWVEQWYGPLERAGTNEARWDAKLRQFVHEVKPITEMPTDPGWSGELLWNDAGTGVSLKFNPKTGDGELLIISTVLDTLHEFVKSVGQGGEC